MERQKHKDGHHSAVWPWASYFVSLCLSFVIWEMDIIIVLISGVVMRIKGVNICKTLRGWYNFSQYILVFISFFPDGFGDTHTQVTLDSLCMRVLFPWKNEVPQNRRSECLQSKTKLVVWVVETGRVPSFPWGVRSYLSTYWVSSSHCKGTCQSTVNMSLVLSVATGPCLQKCDSEILSSESLYKPTGAKGESRGLAVSIIAETTVSHCTDRLVHTVNGCCYSSVQFMPSLCDIGPGSHWF